VYSFEAEFSLSIFRCSYMRKGLQIAYQGLNIVVLSTS
jgi:hypothetical protein